ncbi:MAG: protein BatD [Opitutus sp.]|nr:protein BatD [Opitutus sp.]
MRLRLVLLLALAFVFPAAARAQVVRWESSNSGSPELILVFENCTPDGQPQLPVVDGVQLTLAGQTNSTNIVNFSRTDSVLLTYRIQARSGATIAIPTFTVKTDKGTLRVPAVNASTPRSNVAENVVVARLQPTTLTLWAGEVFPLTYTLDVARRNFSQLATAPDWNAGALVAEEWSKPEPAEVITAGESRLNIIYKTRAYAKTAGPLALGSVTQSVNIQTGSIGFGLFQTPRVEQIIAESNRPQFTVRALPVPAPAGFSGAVGQFKLVSKVIPEKAAVGEPVTWTLELSGNGNWPDVGGLPQRDVSNDFQVVQPKAKRTPAEGKLFDTTLSEDVVLVPTKAGAYALGPVNFTYFDPKAGAYKTLTAPRANVTITAPNAPLFTPAPAAVAPHTAPESAAAKSAAPPVAPLPPAGIPRDPLPGSDLARAPLDTLTLLTWLLSPLFVPLSVWLWLAVRRAQRTDPLRPRREARARLAAILPQLRTAPSPQLLLAWQHDAAVLWQIAHAAPPASALSDQEWAVLWTESDRALYGPQTGLPSDWTARAEAALIAKRVRGFNPLRLFLPRNLLPFAALLALSVFSLQLFSPAALAAEPATAYRSGDFAGAEKAWRTTVAKNPTDWVARHNLALALAQQDRAGEAAAHAAAAFVQKPADPAVRWHFALAAEKAGFAPAPLAPFLAPAPPQSLARLASPAAWQLALIAAAVGTALALAWLLLNSYGRRARGIFWSAGTALAGCGLLGATALFSVLTYGETADARAVVVWHADTLRSIPTEADTTQKTTALAAGSVAIADKIFLGWTRLRFENGQTGWVRKDSLVSLWR